MEKGNFNNLGSFGGFDFEEIEKGLGLVMSESGDSGKTSKEGEEKTKPDNKLVPELDISTKIQIPESEEERKTLGSGEVIEEKEDKTEQEEIKDKVEKEETGEEDALITEDSPLFLHAATLHEEGILPTLNLEDLKGKKHSEALQLYLDAQKKYIEDGRNEYLNSLSDRQKEFLEMIDKGIPQEQAEHQVTIEDTYNKITDEVLADDTDLQEQIVVQSLRLKNLSEKQIDKFLKLTKDEETLFESAKEGREEIKTYIADQKKEKLRQIEEQTRIEEEREKELQRSIQETIDKTEEILPGIKISANEKTKLYELMTKPVEERVINGKRIPINLINKVRMEDRVAFDLRLNYFIEQGLFKKNFDLSKLNKKITSSAAEKLSNKLKESIGGPAGQGLTIDKRKEKKPEKIIFPKF